MKNKKKALLLAAAAAVLILVCVFLALRREPAGGETVREPETVRILTIGDAPEEALERVSETLSAITLERLGCKVELKMIGQSEYDDRIDDLLLESELADIFVCRDRTTMNKLLDGNYIYRLDRYLEQYPQFRQTVPDERAWELVQAEGYTYGIPFGNDDVSRWGFVMRKDICEELNIDVESVTTLEQLHEVLLRVREAYPNLVPVVSNYGEMETFASDDLLVSGAGCLVTESGAVSVSALPEFSQRCALIRRWNEEGLILDNAPFHKEGRGTWMASGLAFGSFAQVGRYTARELEYAAGMPVECVILEEEFYPDSCADMSFVVYAYAEDVNLSLQVLSLIYTDPDVLRMCVYGEENVDYTRAGTGSAVPVDGEEQYVSWCWPLRDRVPAPVTEEDPAWYGGTAEERAAFFFDNSTVANEIYQCGEILEKYFGALCAGMIDEQEGIAMMEDELNEANMETVRAELEHQWMAWLAEN
ncbi:MAG: DUF3502 domain-containing protein [Oscillospiraceae bacterium]